MKNLVKPILFWSPRMLCIFFAVFISLFALDVFGEGLGFWRSLLALTIHLIPTWLVICALIVSWRWERIGGIFFIGLGALYLITSWGRFDWTAYLAISGPLFLIGVLFFTDSMYRLRRQQ